MPQRQGKAMPVHDAITYLENHGERMSYALAREKGLPLGSGGIEAACKSQVALRMKLPGSRWKEDSGQRVLDLLFVYLRLATQEALRQFNGLPGWRPLRSVR